MCVIPIYPREMEKAEAKKGLRMKMSWREGTEGKTLALHTVDLGQSPVSIDS